MIFKSLRSILRVHSARNLSLKVNSDVLDISEEIRIGLRENKPIVALESTIITHGMPFPQNIQCGLNVENIVRKHGAIPATVGLLNGKIKVGLSQTEIEYLGDITKSKPIKTSRRDFPFVIANGRNGGTTVAGTIIICQMVGISIFATGGIGGVHRNANQTFDISTDLTELGRSNVTVICSGIKSILDIAKTLEYLETEGVFVATISHSNEFPAFYTRSSGFSVPYSFSDTKCAANIIKTHRDLSIQSGLLFAVPIPEQNAFDPEIMNKTIKEALEKATEAKITGKDITPFLLNQIGEITAGKSLDANIALIQNNAKVAAEIAVNLFKLDTIGEYNGMTTNFRQQKNVPVIIGGSNVDCIAHLETDDIKLDGRIYPGRFNYTAGGVGRNLCEALGKLECDTHFISAIGDDAEGRILLKQLPEFSLKNVQILNGFITAKYIAGLDKKGDCLFGMADMHIHREITPKIIEKNEDIIKNSPLLIFDANVPIESIEKLLEIAHRYKVPVFFEPTDLSDATKPFTTNFWKQIKFITPNLNELRPIYSLITRNAIGKFNNKIEEAAQLSKELVNHIDNVIVTLGSDGILIARKGLATDPFLFNNDKKLSVRHYAVGKTSNVVNFNGAGDCFASGLIAGLLEGLPEENCVSIGFAAVLLSLNAISAVPDKLFNKKYFNLMQPAKYTEY